MKIEFGKNFEDKFRMTINPSIDPLTLAAISGGLNIGGNILGGITGTQSNRRAEQDLLGGVNQASQFAQQGYGDAIGGLQPFQQGGTEAFGRLSDLSAAGQFDVQAPQYGGFREFSAQDVLNDPGYQFRLGEGEKAVERGAAARGGALGGRGAKDLARFSQGLASSELNNAYNRFSQERQFDYGGQQDLFRNQLAASQQQFGQLSDLSRFGVNAAQNVGNLQTGLSGILGQNAQQIGNIKAGGELGRNQIFQQGLSDLTGGLGDLSGLLGAFGGGGGQPAGDLSNFLQAADFGTA